MLEYLPWSKKVLNEMIILQKEGNIPTLDIELTAKCTGANCIYCDSKPDVSDHGQVGEYDFSVMKKIILEAKNCGLKWIYTCGLGEPMEDSKFWDIIYLLKANNIRLSMFSNGIFIHDINVARELKEHDVNIILKMDTFHEKNFNAILGKEGIASKIYAARDYLIDAGYGNNDGYTDLAFSIVPTRLAIDGIPEVITFAKKYGIFASVGELEQAGEVINNNLGKTLGISTDEVGKLKNIANEYIEGEYMRPICPCIFTGLHIDNLGNCVVDKVTGLNCKWFLLKDPHTIKLGNIYTEGIDSLFMKVNEYRKKCFSNRISEIKKLCDISFAFGGCGGNPKDIIKLALECV